MTSSTADVKDEDAAVRKERFAYWFIAVPSGPAFFALILWSSGFRAAATQDEVCAPFGGHSSGADGASCTQISLWNETLWNASGGADCLASDGFLSALHYTHDPALPGCADALAAYRSAANYSCNCSSEYSYLGDASGGIRTSVVQTIAINIDLVLSSILFPIIGTVLDGSSRKKTYFGVVWVTGGILFFGAAVLAPGGVWVVGLVCGVLFEIFDNLKALVWRYFLAEVADDEPTQTVLAGRKEGASFGTQFLYAVITVGVLQLVLGLDDMLSATIAVIISATLYLGLMPIAHLRLRNHPARSTPKGNPCVAPFTELGQTLKLAFTKYPECAKYIALVVCCENGGGAVGIGLLTIYAQNVLGFGFLETGIISLLLLLLGAPLCVVFPKITAKLGPKKSWALILVMFVVPGVVIPAAFSEPGFGAFIGVLVVYGVVGAMQLAWYITYLQPTLLMLSPADKVGSFIGLHGFCQRIGAIAQPLIYAGVVQGTNNHRVAFATGMIWVILAIVVLLTINFDKGKRDAEAGSKTLTGDVDPKP